MNILPAGGGGGRPNLVFCSGGTHPNGSDIGQSTRPAPPLARRPNRPIAFLGSVQNGEYGRPLLARELTSPLASCVFWRPVCVFFLQTANTGEPRSHRGLNLGHAMWTIFFTVACGLLPAVLSLDNGLASRPPMGLKPDFEAGEEGLDRVADFLISSGLYHSGYQFVNTDAGWAQDARNNQTGELMWSTHFFPSGLPTFISRLHAKGLKFGIYGSASGVTCGDRPGQLFSENIDARSFANWGVGTCYLRCCIVVTRCVALRLPEKRQLRIVCTRLECTLRFNARCSQPHRQADLAIDRAV
jgi:hypothetical protein